MGLHGLRFLTVSRLALCLSQLLQQCDGPTFDAPTELSTLARAKELHEILVAHVQELVKVHTTVGVLAEGALLRLVLVTHSSRWLRLPANSVELRAAGGPHT